MISLYNFNHRFKKGMQEITPDVEVEELERHKLNDNSYADTYFVYNDCSRLYYVLQPMFHNERNKTDKI